MEKEFVPYTESLALKELGFEEPCIAIYQNGGKITYAKLKSNDIGGFAVDKIGVCSSPLYQQAFRWFREKHNLIPNISSIYTDETHSEIEYWFWIANYEVEDDEEVFYGTWEETELECLKQLIKIAKEK